MARKPTEGEKSAKAIALLQRFPVTDLAKAISLTGDNRQKYLQRFVSTFTTQTYTPTRRAALLIYNAQNPLFGTPPEPWESVERFLQAAAKPHVLQMNLQASECLFKLVRVQNYVATKIDAQVLRVGRDRIVPIGLEFYITHGEKVIFQFP
jgi:hypothetical protein